MSREKCSMQVPPLKADGVSLKNKSRNVPISMCECIQLIVDTDNMSACVYMFTIYSDNTYSTNAENTYNNNNDVRTKNEFNIIL